VHGGAFKHWGGHFKNAGGGLTFIDTIGLKCSASERYSQTHDCSGLNGCESDMPMSQCSGKKEKNDLHCFYSKDSDMKNCIQWLLNWLGSLDQPKQMGFITMSEISFSQWPDAAQRPLEQFR
jgi:hypothetical protein